MKEIVKIVLAWLCRLTSIVYPYNFYKRLHCWKNKMHSIWISRSLCHVGHGTIIECGCLLQGGGEKQITIGDNTLIQRNCVLGCWKNYRTGQTFSPKILIGNNCNIGEYSHITAINGITIDDGLLTGRFVLISDNSHGALCSDDLNVYPINRKLRTKGAIFIGKNVWIGDKATILSGVHIGDNVIVAANAVVINDIPSNCLVAGVPARVVKQLISEY